MRFSDPAKEMAVLVDASLDGQFRNDESFTLSDVGGFFANLFPSIPLPNFTLSSQSNEVIAYATGTPVGLVPVDCSDVQTIRDAVGAVPDAINIYYFDSVLFDYGPSTAGA